MDFTIALLVSIEEDSDEQQQQSLAQLVEAAYEACLKPWHGWISSAACKVGDLDLSLNHLDGGADVPVVRDLPPVRKYICRRFPRLLPD
jgi:hypothetical protein